MYVLLIKTADKDVRVNNISSLVNVFHLLQSKKKELGLSKVTALSVEMTFQEAQVLLLTLLNRDEEPVGSASVQLSQ